LDAGIDLGGVAQVSTNEFDGPQHSLAGGRHLCASTRAEHTFESVERPLVRRLEAEDDIVDAERFIRLEELGQVVDEHPAIIFVRLSAQTESSAIASARSATAIAHGGDPFDVSRSSGSTSPIRIGGE
jgi:hypothetical protein